MGTDILIKGGLLADSTGCRHADILIEDGIVSGIGPDIAPSAGTRVFDASGCMVCCALADVHVHFREPGFTEKETILSGSMAAAKGGYSVVCPMPNLNPAPDSVETIGIERSIIERDAVVRVIPYATVTKGRQGCEVVDMKSLKPFCAAFSDDGSGIQEEKVMLEAMRNARENDVMIAAHCEDNRLLKGGYIHDGGYAARHGHSGICSESEWGQIARDLKLVEETGCRYHVCHISTKESVSLIREAKKKGLPVSCETGPHYLVLTDEDLQEDGRFKMNPPIRTSEDRDALIHGIQDGTIDVIATDHAPHTSEQKSKGLEGSAMGIVGLETAFQIMYTHLVRKGIISMERLVSLMSERPRELFRLEGCLKEGCPADVAVFDISEKNVIDSSTFVSKGKATPFDGWEVYGECLLTISGGRTVWEKQHNIYGEE